MATYVTSDAHGHLRALDRVLELAAPGVSDTVYVLGDMIDRGPDPVGVMRLVQALPHAHVLMGNHERMMLDAISSDDEMIQGGWSLNGGWTTAEQLDGLSREEALDLVDWVAGLSLAAVVRVEDLFSAARSLPGEPAQRIYLLAHAGIDALSAQAWLAMKGFAAGDPSVVAGLGMDVLSEMMSMQDPEDLLWIRERFWGTGTGFIDRAGRGPIVIAGHTPTFLLGRFATRMGGPVLDADGRARIVEVGACRDTGGIADRIDIDASAAAGHPTGQVAVMRLEDHATWYAPVLEGE